MVKTCAVCILALSLLIGVAGAWGQAESEQKGPRPFGIGISLYAQNQDYVIDSLSLGIPGMDPNVAKGLSVTNDTTSIHATFDYWLLPFLDVMALVGRVDGKTDVKVSELNLGIPLGDITVEYDGIVYGGGFTLAAGHGRFFGTLTTQYTGTDLDLTDSSVTAWIVTPRAGVTFSRGAVYAGAMYQKAEEKHKGTYTVPVLGTVPFSVTLHEAQPWNFIAGVNLGLGEHWRVDIEGGLGNRTSGLLHVGYRF
ncbi:MAG: hypothetical protein AB1714_09055 [Acidobacteriota bacterium]